MCRAAGFATTANFGTAFFLFGFWIFSMDIKKSPFFFGRSILSISPAPCFPQQLPWVYLAALRLGALWNARCKMTGGEVIHLYLKMGDPWKRR